MAQIYRTKVRELAKALQEPESRSEATEALRGLVDGIVLTPNASGDALEIELKGNLAAMLGATVQAKRSPESDDLSLQVSLVAGAARQRGAAGGQEAPWLPAERRFKSRPKTKKAAQVTQAAFRILVAGACSQRYLQLWSGAA